MKESRVAVKSCMVHFCVRLYVLINPTIVQWRVEVGLNCTSDLWQVHMRTLHWSFWYCSVASKNCSSRV